jgi:hypothetical protein
MALLRDEPDFPQIIADAADALGVVRAFVEKDYWVTQVLRTLLVAFPGQFILKGGTSLSKGHGIIDRFSEDVDILVVPRNDHSATTAEARLLAMVGGVSAALGLTWSQGRSPGRGLHASRGDFISYPASGDDAGLEVSVRSAGILLETGFAGGLSPSVVCTVTALVGNLPGMRPEDHEDLAPFDLPMLEPHRTLIEKCAGLHELASSWKAVDPPRDRRFGRHYYDIYQLLGHQRTLERLQDRRDFEVIVDDVAHISAATYGATATRPDEGYAASPAFQPGRSGPLREWLEAAYEESKVLVARATPPPSFGQVLARVEANAALL